jgi:hypothetical protein
MVKKCVGELCKYRRVVDCSVVHKGGAHKNSSRDGATMAYAQTLPGRSSFKCMVSHITVTNDAPCLQASRGIFEGVLRHNCIEGNRYCHCGMTLATRFQARKRPTSFRCAIHRKSVAHLLFLSSRSFSFGSPMPSSLIAKRQSLSGKQGLS